MNKQQLIKEIHKIVGKIGRFEDVMQNFKIKDINRLCVILNERKDLRKD